MEHFLEAERRFVEKQQRAMDDIKQAMDDFLKEQRLAFQTSSSGPAPMPHVGESSSCPVLSSGPAKWPADSQVRGQQGASGPETESLLDSIPSTTEITASVGLTQALTEMYEGTEDCAERLFHTKTNRTRDITPRQWPQHTLLPIVRGWQWNIFSSLIVLSMCLSLGQEVHCHMKEQICIAVFKHPWPCNDFVSRNNLNHTSIGIAQYEVCPSYLFVDGAWDWWKIANISFFTIEMFVRILAEQRDFFAKANPMRVWNVLDTCLWAISVVDLVTNNVAVQILRVFRLGRAIRLFEVFPELRAMFWSCFACGQSLLWAFLLLAGFMYIVGIYFMVVALYYLKDTTHLDNEEEYKLNLASNWNGLYISLMSLMYSITGGLSWQPLAEPFYHMGAWGDFHGFVFTAFIAMSTIGLLNILIGIFAQKATDVSSVSRDAAITQAYLKIMDNRRNMEEIFDEFDKDADSHITTKEIEVGLTQPRIQAYFYLLDIDVADEKLFLDHFDENHNGYVSKDEFVKGCQMLQGACRPLREMKRLRDLIERS